MKNKIVKIFFIFFFGIISLMLYGCTNSNGITFYRESAINSKLQELRDALPKQSTITNSSGVVIYKDNTNTNSSTNFKDTKFGPADINFDLPIKFK